MMFQCSSYDLDVAGSAFVYVDGFNLYYGALKATRYRWLDLSALSKALLRSHRIDRIKYFTARVSDRPDDPSQSQRQDAYLRALATISSVELHFGLFRTLPKSVPLARKQPDGTRMTVKALITEEKGTDVALGAHLVWDSCHRLMDTAMVISNDSDLQTPIEMAQRSGIDVVLVNPHRRNRQTSHLHGSDRRNLHVAHLVRSQLPDEVVDSSGQTIRRPPTWA